ncbi:helix-turn-helix domain-containing protein [Methylobacterium sp. P5_C11]
MQRPTTPSPFPATSSQPPRTDSSEPRRSRRGAGRLAWRLETSQRTISCGYVRQRDKPHQTYLSGVERGKRNPSIFVLQRIATALKLDVSVLVEPRPR